MKVELNEKEEKYDNLRIGRPC